MNRRAFHFPYRQARPRGFAAILAISLIILVGMALATLAAYFAMEASRTRAQTDGAQLRQLLTAGAVTATAQAEAGDGTLKLELPRELNDASVSIRISGSGDDRTALVTAAIGRRTLAQTLKLHRDQSRWTVVSAEFDAPAQLPASTQPSERSTAASQRS